MTTSSVTEALKEAHHELTELNGLEVYEGGNPESMSVLSLHDTINKIEQALAVSERSLSERIETAFDRAFENKALMQDKADQIHRAEETAKMDNSEAWTSAKNNDIRRAVILEALAEDEEYQAARTAYYDARNIFRLALLEVERLKLLVELQKAGDR